GNKVIKSWGEPTKFDFQPKDHLELGEALGIIDVQRASKVSGTRFGYLLGDAVLLEFALVQFAIKTLTENGFAPIIPPALTRVSIFHELGYSEHGGNEGYYLVYDPKKESPEEEANYYLIGTAEHGIVPYFMDEVLRATDLPKRFIGFSSAFRREAGSYGKDTHGIFRVHQFDKVEMVSFVNSADSEKEHEYLLSLEEKLFQALEIPYQVVKICTGDLGHPAARKCDIEAWMPGQGKYREVTSTSTTTDYQARRLNIKYRDGSETKYVHILNGTAFAIGRTIIAILENYQQEDGSIIIPEVLRPYMGKEKITAK
ncbi:MAG: serine--tRNA ligase, partial [Candidatus Blackburnbacteria bacterium]|nr:serine--tRNA ligase [Candidatus Blackburnbacteria bacterium]